MGKAGSVGRRLEIHGVSYFVYRADAALHNQMFYFNGKPCRHGHIAPRYTSSHSCVICQSEFRKALHERHPRVRKRPEPKLTKVVDWSHLSQAQRAVWYMRVDRLMRGTQKTYRHHPLDERAVFLQLNRKPNGRSPQVNEGLHAVSHG